MWRANHRFRTPDHGDSFGRLQPVFYTVMWLMQLEPFSWWRKLTLVTRQLWKGALFDPWMVDPPRYGSDIGFMT